MIEVKDRIPKKPNRILITPENGSAPFYATWQRADEPIEEGTPINKVLFDSIDEGGFSFAGTDDIEICAQRVSIGAEWTTVKFNKPFSGIPRVFASGSEAYRFAIKNVTPESCQIAVYVDTTATAYVASTSNGNNNKSITYVSGSEFIAATIDILSVYDGGVDI